MTKINDLVNLLRDVRDIYQASWIDAEETKKKELAILERDYKKGSLTYKAKKQEIELNFDVAIVAAREKAAKRAAEEIESMKEWERTSVGIINTELLSKINALRGIPVTTEELAQILKKHGSGNYWVQKAAGALAEENGIPVTDLPLDSSLDVKLGVLDQLSGQLDKLLNHYDRTANTPQAANARFLYLNDSILENAVNIYNDGVKAVSEMDAAAGAYLKIRAMSGQMSKACAITNSLRNLKTEDAKNALLYKLATDNEIMPEAYAVAGISDEMAEWKNGKAGRYLKAKKMTDMLKTVQDTEKIKETLGNYAQRVRMGTEQENKFLRHELVKAHKKNSFVMKAVGEMSREERETLLKRDAETDREGGQAQPGQDGGETGQRQGRSAADSYMQAYKSAMDAKPVNALSGKRKINKKGERIVDDAASLLPFASA